MTFGIRVNTDSLRFARRPRFISFVLAGLAVVCFATAAYLFTVLINVRALFLSSGYQSFVFVYDNYPSYIEALATIGIVLSLVSFGLVHPPKYLLKSTQEKQTLVSPKNLGAQHSSFDPRLSGLRGVASLSVVAFHFLIYSQEGTPSFHGFEITNQYLAQFMSSLYVGVPVFFMLSIFLILPHLERDHNLKRYFKRRIFRIWPIYFGTVIAVFVLSPFPLSELLGLVTFSTYFTTGAFPTFTSLFWSLQVEELIYLILPLIALLTIQNKKILGVVLIASSFAFMFASPYLPTISFAHLYTHYPTPWALENLQQFFPVTLAAYGLGLVVYTTKLPRLLRFLLPVGIAGLAGFLITGFDFTLLSYFFVLLSAAAILSHPPAFLKWFTIIGEESYALYALHPLFLGFFGLPGIPLVLVTAFLVEFALRRKQITERLAIAYSRRKPGPVATSFVGLQ